jgi:hypothetical protein
MRSTVQARITRPGVSCRSPRTYHLISFFPSLCTKPHPFQVAAYHWINAGAGANQAVLATEGNTISVMFYLTNAVGANINAVVATDVPFVFSFPQQQPAAFGNDFEPSSQSGLDVSQPTSACSIQVTPAVGVCCRGAFVSWMQAARF